MHNLDFSKYKLSCGYYEKFTKMQYKVFLPFNAINISHCDTFEQRNNQQRKISAKIIE